MSLVEKLRTIRHVPQVNMHLFLNSLKRGEKTVHVFYEGKTDNSFYGSIIKRALGDRNVKVNTKVCGRKQEVYNTREKLCSREYTDNYLVFFVDKDIDDIIPVHFDDFDNVHVTELYSIENYLVSRDMFESTCSELFKMDMGSECISLLGNLFSKLENDFFTHVKTIMAWIIVCRRRQESPLLRNIDLRNLFEIDNDFCLKLLYENKESLIQYLTDKAKAGYGITKQELDMVEQEISSYDYKIYVRGKYHVWLMINAINKAKKLFDDSGIPVKLHVNINDNTAFDLLGPRIMTPKSISDFLQDNILVDLG